jgi:hypothetical protein
MKMAVVWVVAPCSLVEIYQRFTLTCSLHHQNALKRQQTYTRLHGATTQKTAICFLSLARTAGRLKLLKHCSVSSVSSVPLATGRLKPALFCFLSLARTTGHRLSQTSGVLFPQSRPYRWPSQTSTVLQLQSRPSHWPQAVSN